MPKFEDVFLADIDCVGKKDLFYTIQDEFVMGSDPDPYSDPYYGPIYNSHFYTLSDGLYYLRSTRSVDLYDPSSDFAPKKVTSITNGLGGSFSMTYQPSTHFDPFITATDVSEITTSDELYEATLPIPVVYQVCQKDANGNNYTMTYEYSDAVISKTRGFVGRKEIRVTNSLTTGKTIETYNFLVPVNSGTGYELVMPHLVKQESFVGSTAVQTTTNTWEYFDDIAEVNIDYPYVETSTTTDHLNSTSVTTTNVFEPTSFTTGGSLGNKLIGVSVSNAAVNSFITQQKSTVNDGVYSTVTETEYELFSHFTSGHDYALQLRPRTVLTERENILEGTVHNVFKRYEYVPYSNINLANRVNYDVKTFLDASGNENIPFMVINNYNYFTTTTAKDFGKISTHEVIASQDPDDSADWETNPTSAKLKKVSTSYTYTTDGRFVKTLTDPLGFVTENKSFDNVWGKVTEKENHNGLTTDYEYDSFGKLEKTTYPDGIQELNVLHWAGTNGPTDAVYYKYSVTSGNSPMWTWYDIGGRELRSEYYGLDETKKVRVDNNYTDEGQLYTVSKPYFDDESGVTDVTYSYDDYGRLTSAAESSSTTSKDYSTALTVTTSTTFTDGSDSRSVVEKVNSAGEVIETTTNGKKVSFVYYPSGKVKTATPYGGSAVTNEYNMIGNRTKLDDPDAGIVTSTYNALGELLSTTHKKNEYGQTVQDIETSYTYDAISRVCTTSVDNVETINDYSSITGFLTSTINPDHEIWYTYDNGTSPKYGRITTVTEKIKNGGTVEKTFSTTIQYDDYGREYKRTYPSNYYITNEYDDNGYLIEVKDKNNASIWEAVAANAYGQLTQVKKGVITTVYGYDSNQMPSSITAGTVFDQDYSFTDNGNLEWRKDYRSGYYTQEERFDYDTQNRLTDWDVYFDSGTTPLSENSIAYDATTGNMTSKSDLEYTMNYDHSTKPHALTSISGNPSLMSNDQQQVTYTDFKKVKTVTEGSKSLTLTYGIDQQRCKGVIVDGSTTTRYYLGDYEEDHIGSTVKKYHYLSGGDGLAAIYVETNGSGQLYYAYTDYLGSLTALTNTAGTVVEKYAYDPWGNRRNHNYWKNQDTRTSLIVDRGFTMHEHLDGFSLINMNGRVYDPQLGSFLSPDPYIQDPGNWLNYNRYSYAYGNPLRYTDPDGEIAIPIYIVPNIGWSRDGGLSIGISVGVGFPGGLNVQVGANYSFGAKDFSAYVAGTYMFNTVYASYSVNNGWSVGYTAGLTIFAGSPVGTNFLTAGINYNISHNKWSGNLSAWSISEEGSRFNPSVSAMVYPEHTTNLVRGKGWNSNDAVLSNYKSGKYNLNGHNTWQDAAINYFGFKGTFDLNLSSVGHCDEHGVISYGPSAFEKGFDYLNYVAAEEMYHSRDVKRGTYDGVNWNDDFQKSMAQAEGEYKANMFIYKRQGLFKGADPNFLRARITRYGNYWGRFDRHLSPSVLYYNFTNKWWHNIYRIPRKW